MEVHQSFMSSSKLIIGFAILVFSFVSFVLAVEDVVTPTHGTITRIDATAKTIAVKTADGTEHVFYWARDLVFMGQKWPMWLRTIRGTG